MSTSASLTKPSNSTRTDQPARASRSHVAKSDATGPASYILYAHIAA